MAFKEILLHLDASESVEARINVAVELAQRYNAHIKGLYILSHTLVPAYTEVMVGVEQIEEQLAELARKEAKRIEQQFLSAAQAVDVKAECLCVQGDAISLTSRYAHYCDLVIMGQAERNSQFLDAEGLADHVILMAGKPVLVVPYIGVNKNFGQRVMIAWNGGREGTRAVHDALPLLQQAKSVEIATVDMEDGERLSQYLRDYLAIHNIRATCHHFPARDIEIGAMLLSRVADEGIDLMVMGAYGHSRFRELMLGGVTLHLLKHMTVPVLMSH